MNTMTFSRGPRLSLKTTLAALFGLLALVAAAQGLLTIAKTMAIRRSVTEVAINWLPSVAAINRIALAANEVCLKQYRLITVSTDAKSLAENRRSYLATLDGLTQARKLYEPLIASSEERALYNRFAALWEQYAAASTRILALVDAGRLPEALTSLSGPEMLGLVTSIGEALDKGATYNQQGGQRDADASVAHADVAVAAAIVAIGLAVAAALGAMLFGLLRVSRPISRMTQAMSGLAAGDSTTAVPYRERHDEIGAMAAAVQVFKDNLIHTRKLEEETALARAGAEAQRRSAMHVMADQFERAVGSIVGTVTAAASELQATARSLSGTASATAGQSTMVAAAAEQAASNVNTVAAAAEELGTSVQEIGRQVSSSALLAQTAVSEADQTGTLVRDLSTSAGKIGEVVSVISTIAGQTNLLALNATIEAARAGEAGRGFAVVAAEVKELATQTARATQDIAGQIAHIQGSTEQAVAAIQSIAARIREMSGVSTSISAAVEEQGAATQEIVRNVAQAATGTGEVTRNIAGVASAVEVTGLSASQVLDAASALSRQSEQLRTEVSRFLSTVRAA